MGSIIGVIDKQQNVFTVVVYSLINIDLQLRYDYFMCCQVQAEQSNRKAFAYFIDGQ